MPEVKPIPEVHPASRFIKNSLPGGFPFYPSFLPATPKHLELRAWHEALHAAETDRSIIVFINPWPTRENENG